MNDIITNCKLKNGEQLENFLINDRQLILFYNISGFGTGVTAASVSPTKQQPLDLPNPALPITEVCTN